MTKQQYFIAALCILFMAGLQFAGFKMKEKTGKNNPLWYDDDEEDDKGKGSAKAKTAEKVPDEVEDSELDFEQQKRLAAAWTETKIREEVRIAVIERPQRFGRRIQILKSLGWRVDAPVLEILNDSKLSTKLTTPVKSNFYGDVTPLGVAIDLMEQSTEKLVDPLLPYAKHASVEVRGGVAEVLAQHPSPKTLPLLKPALTDGEAYVQQAVTTGLSKAKRVDAASQTELYPIVQRQVNDGKNRTAASALLVLDEKRAIEFFESEPFIRVESPGLSHALHALVERKKNLPREKLLKLIQVQKSSVLDNGLGWQMNGSALLLGRQQHPDDAKLFESLIDQSTTAEHVSDGYLAYHGMNDVSDRVYDAYEKKKWEGLTELQQNFYAVYELDAEVNNGGLHQYFSNSSGEHAREALRGLYAIGMPERAKRLKKEFDRFGVNGPSKDPTIFVGQLDKLSKTSEDPFDAYDTAYYSDKSSIAAYLAKYAVKNKESFK